MASKITKNKYEAIAKSINEELLTIDGLKEVLGNLVDSLRENIYTKNSIYADKIIFTKSGNELLIKLSVSIFYGYQISKVSKEINDIIRKHLNENGIESEVKVNVYVNEVVEL